MQELVQEGERLCEINDKLRLIMRENGLAFGTDAYLLSCFCRGAKGARAADLGTGTGVISLLLAARERYQKIYAVEAQEVFADLAKRNVALNGFSDTVSVLMRDVRELHPRDFDGELDVVFTNPPYMRPDTGFASRHDEKQIARHEVLGDLFDFTSAAARILRFGGTLYIVYRPDRLDTLFAALRAAKFAPKRLLFVQDTPEKAPSIVLVESRLGGGEGLVLLPTLCLRESSTNGAPLTPRAARIYDTGFID